MPAKYWAFFVFIFVVGTIMGLLMENEMIGADEQSTLEGLMVWQETQSEGMGWISAVPAYFNSLLKALVWDFAFLTGNWVYIKWIIWAPLMAMMVWGLIVTFLGAVQKVLG
jgi:hypothetical protein